MEDEKNTAVRETRLVPKCHMSKMELRTKGDKLWWTCLHCGAEKEYQEESEMPEVKEENIIPDEAEENSETQIIDVQFDLTDTELLEIGEKIGDLDQEEDTLVAAKKAAVSLWGAKLNACKSEKKALCVMLKTKVEIRTLECHVDPDYDAGMMCFVSVETGAVVYQRKMTDSERQMKLFEE